MTFSSLSYILSFVIFICSFATFPCSGQAESIQPGIKTIIINNDSVLYSSSSDQPMKQPLILNYSDNSLRFEIQPEDSIQYQFFLEGFDKKWTGWTKVSFKEYTSLPAGNYSFRVRYIYRSTEAGESSLLKFRILRLWYLSDLAITVYVIVVMLIIWIIYDTLKRGFKREMIRLELIINKRTEDLLIEKEKTDALLARVLPKTTASEIMEKGKATKIKYNFVTVLFSDIQGFTKIAEEVNPEVLIDELDKFFFYFDSVVEKFGIEKIKTIGDAYMCAGGIPEKNRTNPVEVILAALEMRTYMSELRESSEFEGMKFWDIRIGIHTGTVIAGVVGQKKLSYDIWGDTVNTASRMESSGEGGRINISGTTYEFVKDFFTCEFRGKMPVKYKGELEMYFVKGIIPELCDETGGPNRKFILKMQLIKLLDMEEMILKLFDDEAPPDLYFHNSAMVRNISNQVELLARAENLGEEEYINLKLAALYLLTGYIYDYGQPLDASLRLVEEVLPRYGFNERNVEETRKLVTNCHKGHQESLSDNILHDARYDYMGRVDYIKLADKLMRERTEHGILSDSGSWIGFLKDQLTKHEFLTNSAKVMRSVSVKDQIAGLQVSAVE